LYDAGQLVAVVHEVVGTGQGRNKVAQAAAVVHVAVGAVLGIEALAFVLLVREALGEGEQGRYTCSQWQELSFYPHPSSFSV
jgi:hypothetical protein